MISLTFHDLTKAQAAALLDAADTQEAPKHVAIAVIDEPLGPFASTSTPGAVSVEDAKKLGRTLSAAHPKKGMAVREILTALGVSRVDALDAAGRVAFAQMVEAETTRIQTQE